MRSETEEYDTEVREAISWEMENEGTETTEGEGSGRDAEEGSMTTTVIAEEEHKKKESEQSGNQEMNVEEDWHAGETSSTEQRITDIEAQSKAARHLEWNTNGGWTSNDTLIHDPQFVNDTPVTVTIDERPKGRNKLITRFGNPIPSLLPNLIQHTEIVGIPELKENEDIFIMSRRE